MKFRKVFVPIVLWMAATSGSQAQPGLNPEQALQARHPKKVHKFKWFVELNLEPFYFPIYDLGTNGYYKVDGHQLMRSTLQYYCAIPGQKIWAKYTTDPTDQAWVLAPTFGFSWHKKVKKPADSDKMKRIQFVVALTHDKAQTNSQAPPFFKLNDGGGEITLLASYGWQLGENLMRETHDTQQHLKIDVFFQAGPIFCFNDDSVNIHYNGTQIFNQYPTYNNLRDRHFEGYGVVGNVHTAFGYGFRRWSWTFGFNIGAEWQHHIVAVTENNESGHRLTLNSYSLFLTPLLDVRFRIGKKNDAWQKR